MATPSSTSAASRAWRPACSPRCATWRRRAACSGRSSPGGSSAKGGCTSRRTEDVVSRGAPVPATVRSGSEATLDAGMGNPVILFGAFDRHNFGDLLFPHVLAALLPGRELKYAGLASRDLRPHGGHRVEAVGRVIAGLAGQPATLVHVGGELLTCDAWQAAVMLSTHGDAQRVVARLDALPRERMDWARGVLGTDALGPYAISRERHPGLASVRFHAVGGVGLNDAPAGLRAEVLAALATADDVSVRDAQTQAVLAKAGIAARLLPDPVTRVAELFGE